jgi:hypothetical protein
MSARIIHLPSGRPVLDTGRVLVGLRHGERRPVGPATADQARLQQLMLHKPQPCRALTEAELDAQIRRNRDAWEEAHARQAAEPPEDDAPAPRPGVTLLLAVALAAAVLTIALASALWPVAAP